MSKPTTIDEYIAAQPQEAQERLQKIRETIQKAAPQTTESISYDMPTFSLNGKHFIYFAAWKSHISIYAIYRNNSSIEPEIAPYRKEKDSLHFVHTEPVPYDLLEKIVKIKLEEHSA